MMHDAYIPVGAFLAEKLKRREKRAYLLLTTYKRRDIFLPDGGESVTEVVRV